MKYLVLEVHPGYAVLLDTEGRFVRAANLGYTVGETVTDIVIMRENAGSRFGRTVKLVSGIAAAACVCLVGAGLYLGYYVPNYAEYGTVAMEINPGIRMTLSRTGRVLDLEGINADGEALASGYEFRGKPEKTVADELADRAVAMGYLSDGGEIILAVSAEDTVWRDDTEREAVRTLQEHMEELSSEGSGAYRAAKGRGAGRHTDCDYDSSDGHSDACADPGTHSGCYPAACCGST